MQKGLTEPDKKLSLPQIVPYRSACRCVFKSEINFSHITTESSILVQLEFERLMFQDSRDPPFMSTPREQHRTICHSSAIPITNSQLALSAQEAPTSPRAHPRRKPLPTSMEQTWLVNFLSRPEIASANHDIHSAPCRNQPLR